MCVDEGSIWVKTAAITERCRNIYTPVVYTLLPQAPYRCRPAGAKNEARTHCYTDTAPLGLKRGKENQPLLYTYGPAGAKNTTPSEPLIVDPVITYTPLGEASGIGIPSYRVHEAGHVFSKCKVIFGFYYNSIKILVFAKLRP